LTSKKKKEKFVASQKLEKTKIPEGEDWQHCMVPRGKRKE
jgi:hypothetical protein